MIDYYKSLPDYMPVDELEKLFKNYLIQVKANNFDIEESLEALLELADRQWHTYELLSEDLKNEIEEWLLSIIDFDSHDIIEYLMLITGRLGLSKLYATIKGSLTGNLKKEVRQEIKVIVNEIDGHVENPYYGMK